MKTYPLTRTEAADLIVAALSRFPAAERLSVHEAIECTGHAGCPWRVDDLPVDASPDHECCRCPWWDRVNEALKEA